MQSVKRKGFVSVPEKSLLFQNTDIVVCVSRDDPEPKVVAEAFMWSKVVLLSQNVGQKDLIENDINGFVVGIDNVNELRNKIIKIIDGEYKFDKIGERARDLYLNNYTLNAFEEQLMKVIKEGCE